ncbi:class I SAM-dependent methyltransferase [Jiulongibacter sp. NS-SX5]|uniref:class I SAM-dependent methyltransferase n=1 Tax=Jiulongibacter sp. NS-SX5 TaxID=3463854 RepID=UPI0040598EC2
MSEFWENHFKAKKEMWGQKAAHSAELAFDILDQNAKTLLIPGIGYGRNARVFVENGFEVTGIEISETAIALAKERFDNRLKIFHGSVSDMPYDKNTYDAIYCHAVIHLLDSNERIQLLQNCYRQLRNGGLMIFTAISQSAQQFGKGLEVSENRYETHAGAPIFYYSEEHIRKEFSPFGLTEYSEIQEDQPMFFVICRK